MPEDSRKAFLLTTTANYFGIPPADGTVTELESAPALNTFLDDGSCKLLAGRIDTRGGRNTLTFNTKVILL